jgi:hypothetical protein
VERDVHTFYLLHPCCVTCAAVCDPHLWRISRISCVLVEGGKAAALDLSAVALQHYAAAIAKHYTAPIVSKCSSSVHAPSSTHGYHHNWPPVELVCDSYTVTHTFLNLHR